MIYCILNLTAVHDKMLEGILQSTCEKALVVEQYPRTAIVVTVQEMQDRGNVCIIDLLFNELFLYNNLYLLVIVHLFECLLYGINELWYRYVSFICSCELRSY